MKTWQLELLTEDELSMLVYIVNVLSPIHSPKFEIKKPSDLLLIKHDALLWKCSQQAQKLSEEGKPVFEGMMTKLNMTLSQYFESIKHQLDYDNSIQPEFTQSEFQF